MENSSRDGNAIPLYLSSEKPVCWSRSNSMRHGQWTVSKLGKEYIKTVYCHIAYLRYMQSISCEMLDESQARIKIVGRNINNLRYAADNTLTAESEEEGNKEPLDEGEKEE